MSFHDRGFLAGAVGLAALAAVLFVASTFWPVEEALGLGTGGGGRIAATCVLLSLIAWLSDMARRNAIASLAPCLVTAWRWLNGDWRVSALLSIPALYVWVLTTRVIPGLPWVAPDTGTYLGFAVYRTLLYPLLLRLIAITTESPQALHLPQLAAGLAVTVLFAESYQRLVRNALASVLVGLFLLFNWPLLNRSLYLLADYPFYVLFTAALCVKFGIMRDPRPFRLVVLALLLALAVAIRPVGIALLAFVPVLLLLRPWLWRRVTVYLIAPLMAALLGIAAVNARVLDYFALENFGGFGASANAMLILRADTPTTVPVLRDALLARAEPYRTAFVTARTAQDRYSVIAEATDSLLDIALEEARRFGRAERRIEPTDSSRHRLFVGALNETSPLNRTIGNVVPIQDDFEWRWLDRQLGEIGRQARLHNPLGLAIQVLTNLRFAPQGFLPFERIPETFTAFRAFSLDHQDLGMGTVVIAPARDDVPLVSVAGFNVVASAMGAADRLFSFPLAILMSAGFVCGAAITIRARRRAIPEDMSGLVGLVAVALAYSLAVCYGQIPLGRLMIVCAAPMAALLTVPILLPGWACQELKDA
ncbi:hypothetical protein CU669_11100 [Paramagnetospirillum kuznetsovii]|uniref:Glycosyltransferase RgtA/B/C/D-like domain-containing protein n=1 Tax=Paramagnetospirillum kuznetsovii TaxID=2053833 RepID=A0A364NY62_9PROT|nr:hypothetical protein [Paramagnetospirillum kuznetsovii]RAU21845.1 hypothetical protein CU669_11100 [Paramagnetospirillum kuznetsovii]